MSALEQNRAAGCLLGLACGDAVGAAVEFLPRGRFHPLTDMVGGGKFRLDKGYWTDDTSMALCLADSLLAVGGFDAEDQMQRYYRWFSTGYNSSKPMAFGIGQTVLRSLFAYKKTGNPYSGSTESRHSGNGSLMRLAPIPLFYFSRPDLARSYAVQSSRTTHGSRECLEACQYFSHVLVKALSGISKEEIFECSDLCEMESIHHICRRDFICKTENEVKGSGFVVESLEAAIWAFWHTDSFKDAILAAANLGDDADTTAAICGQLAGAYYGRDSIPADWLSALHCKDHIENIALRLAEGCLAVHAQEAVQADCPALLHEGTKQ